MTNRAKVEALALAFNDAIAAQYPDGRIRASEVIRAASTIIAVHIANLESPDKRDEMLDIAVGILEQVTGATIRNKIVTKH